MLDELFDNAEKDLSKVRVIEYEGNSITIAQKDPYGFWYLHQHTGNLPNSLKGAYTSYPEALKAAENYITNRRKEIKKITT